MWISAEYYPGTNESTCADHGYTWTPAIAGGYYTLINWEHWWIPSTGGFELRANGSSQIWYPGGGPSLPDPYNPTPPPENPVPEIIRLKCKIFVGGVSQPLIDNIHEIVTGIDAPLIIGPVP